MFIQTSILLRSLHRLSTSTTLSASKSAKMSPPQTPKPSASLLLLSPKNQILLMTRPSKPTTSFRGAVVFPGGALSPEDKEDYKICALRELFEECGVLLLKDRAIFANGKEADWVQKARREVHSGQRSFGDVLKDVDGEVDVDGCVEFTRWITPPTKQYIKRFDTRMFLYMLDEAKGKEGGAEVEGDKVVTEELPAGDGGIEVVSTSFMKIGRALEMNRAGEITFFPPQFYLLSVLKRFLGDEVKGTPAEKRAALRAYLQKSDFGGRLMTPIIHAGEPRDDGRHVLGFGPKGGKGKLLVKVGPRGPQDLQLLHDGVEIESKL